MSKAQNVLIKALVEVYVVQNAFKTECNGENSQQVSKNSSVTFGVNLTMDKQTERHTGAKT